MFKAGLSYRLTTEQKRELELFLKVKKLPLSPREKRARQKAQALWLSAEGWTAREIAGRFNKTERWVWKWRRAYKQKGLNGLI